ncbi:Hypothetical protein EAG7_00257 [Klebsiella aerogenes]|nr:Hypothetical protein EAG7_00257 [Klebsiella aerogenes]CCG28877.1 hypothetical protein [Klebsiella aerogenes EA1509E]
MLGNFFVFYRTFFALLLIEKVKCGGIGTITMDNGGLFV